MNFSDIAKKAASLYGGGFYTRSYPAKIEGELVWIKCKGFWTAAPDDLISNDTDGERGSIVIGSERSKDWHTVEILDITPYYAKPKEA